MQTEIYSVTSVAAGHLYIMPCPNRQRVVQDLRHLQQLGIHKVVSLLETDEAQRCGLENESDICAAFSMEFAQFPIQDRQVPTHPAQFRQLVNQLYDELCSGKHVAIHCYAGIGRTGLLAASILIKHGMNPVQAADLLSDIRKYHVPQTTEQYHYLLDFAAGEEQRHAGDRKKKQTKWFNRLLSPA